ncbi:MAG: TatD family hydrolase [Bacilli bacterium]
MRIIDTHTHINDEKLFKDRKEVIERAKLAGVNKVINNGDSFESFKVIGQLAEEYPDFCYSALGIFPGEGTENIDEDIDRLRSMIKQTKNVVAIGEIGLDYYWDKNKEKKDQQKELFKRQIALAEELDLPIIVHSRDAEADTLNIILNSKFKGNVTLHCYSGSFQMANRYLRHKKNVYFGIGGVLTFKNARKLVEVVQKVNPENFLLETDAPYLSPVPHRGERNEPAFIVKTLEKMAELLDRDEEDLSEEIYQRSLKVYRIHE